MPDGNDNGLARCGSTARMRLTGRRLGRLTAVLVACVACTPLAAAQAQPTDTTVLFDDFESGSLAPNWTASTSGNGLAAVQNAIGTSSSKGARLTVPDYSTNSMAYVKHTLATPAYGVSMSGRFKVLSGGCSDAAGYSAGSVPFMRLF